MSSVYPFDLKTMYKNVFSFQVQNCQGVINHCVSIRKSRISLEQWQIQDFPGGASSRGVPQSIILKKIGRKLHEMKEFGPRGRGRM